MSRSGAAQAGEAKRVPMTDETGIDPAESPNGA
jgi:hypothetical protein